MQDRTRPSFESLAPALARAERLVHAFNGTGPGEDVERRALLDALLGSLGPDVVVRPRFVCELGTEISIGAGTWVHYDCLFVDLAPLTIGAGCRIGPGVHIYTADHLPAPDASGVPDGQCAPVWIGNGVWIGSGARVLPGVSVGDGAVIGAGAVVDRDVAPGEAVAGISAGLPPGIGSA